MSGSRSRRRRKRAASTRRDGARAAAQRPAAQPQRARPASTSTGVAKEVAEPDAAALRAEIRSLKRALATAEQKVGDAEQKRTRAVARATGALKRENESLEAHLTLLVQEIGQIKHLVDRVPRLEADLRAREMQLAERSAAWLTERAALLAEIERLRGVTHKGASGARAALAAAAAAASVTTHRERAR